MSERPTTEDFYERAAPADGKSAGELMKEITEDLSTLLRKEIELAKQEVGGSVKAKATGAAVIAVAGIFTFFALVFLFLALRDGLDELMWRWAADLVTTAILVVVGAVVALIAKRKLQTPISADLTKRTVKEDIEWAKSLGKK